MERFLNTFTCYSGPIVTSDGQVNILLISVVHLSNTPVRLLGQLIRIRVSANNKRCQTGCKIKFVDKTVAERFQAILKQTLNKIIVVGSQRIIYEFERSNNILKINLKDISLTNIPIVKYIITSLQYNHKSLQAEFSQLKPTTAEINYDHYSSLRRLSNIVIDLRHHFGLKPYL